MQVDYIIVGLGLAGLAFSETLVKNNKSFLVFEDASQNSSLVAAGAYNPIVLKRFNAVWDVQDQLSIALPFYEDLEKKLKGSYHRRSDIFRILNSVEEQNNWTAASDKPILSDYMKPEIEQNKNPGVIASFGLGRVVNTGRIKTQQMLGDYKAWLSSKGQLIEETFEHGQILFGKAGLTYKDYSANRLVFCEGFGLRQNPFFKQLPMEEAKGELLTIHAPGLNLDATLKGPIFVQPLGDDHYKVGATFNWSDKTLIPTQEAKDELISKLEKMISVGYTIVDHKAGIRPTVKDRRPLLGAHGSHPELAILNGLGTRGVILAPKMAQLLYGYLEKDEALPSEINIARFRK